MVVKIMPKVSIETRPNLGRFYPRLESCWRAKWMSCLTSPRWAPLCEIWGITYKAGFSTVIFIWVLGTASICLELENDSNSSLSWPRFSEKGIIRNPMCWTFTGLKPNICTQKRAFEHVVLKTRHIKTHCRLHGCIVLCIFGCPVFERCWFHFNC